jgi:hypothetical protein
MSIQFSFSSSNYLNLFSGYPIPVLKAGENNHDNMEDEELLTAMEEPEDNEDVEARECEDQDCEASDQAVLDKLDRALEDDDKHEISPVTRDDVNLGRFSIHKVGV